jgi:4-carboxymuconolactone decarboxylase
MVCVVIDAAAKSPVELALHLRMARRAGWTEDELTEVLLFMAGYVGIPASREALVVAKDVFAAMRAETDP